MRHLRVIVAGGSGFIGNAVVNHLSERENEVIVLTRRPRVRVDGIREVAWDGKSLGNWEQFVDGADVVINLAGKNINCVFNAANRRLIVESRVNSVRAIAEAVRKAARPPRVWIQASAIGYYGETWAAADESTANGNGFLAETCRAWEEAMQPDSVPAVRCVTLRFGVVLGRNGGALKPLLRLTRCFFGGAAGNGRQYISWVHLSDLVQVTTQAMEHESWRGVFNVTSPHPVTNAQFMRELRLLLDRPWSPPAPAWAVRLFAPLMATDPSLALESQRVLPRRLLVSGFQFGFPELRSALLDILSPPREPC